MDWLAGYAARAGLRYAPEADERWLRAWEPYATLRVPVRYEHLLEGPALTVARFVLDGGASAWIAIAQDDRVRGRAAVTNDGARTFGDGPEMVTMARRHTGDAAFDAAFAVFAPSSDELGADGCRRTESRPWPSLRQPRSTPVSIFHRVSLRCRAPRRRE